MAVYSQQAGFPGGFSAHFLFDSAAGEIHVTWTPRVPKIRKRKTREDYLCTLVAFAARIAKETGRNIVVIDPWLLKGGAHGC